MLACLSAVILTRLAAFPDAAHSVPSISEFFRRWHFADVGVLPAMSAYEIIADEKLAELDLCL